MLFDLMLTTAILPMYAIMAGIYAILPSFQILPLEYINIVRDIIFAGFFALDKLVPYEHALAIVGGYVLFYRFNFITGLISGFLSKIPFLGIK